MDAVDGRVNFFLNIAKCSLPVEEQHCISQLAFIIVALK